MKKIRAIKPKKEIAIQESDLEEIFEPVPDEDGPLDPEIEKVFFNTGKSPTPTQKTDIQQTKDENIGIDDYIKRQVLNEMYGTDNPSNYDKISLALKKLL